jgi:hypothetical protein
MNISNSLVSFTKTLSIFNIDSFSSLDNQIGTSKNRRGFHITSCVSTAGSGFFLECYELLHVPRGSLHQSFRIKAAINQIIVDYIIKSRSESFCASPSCRPRLRRGLQSLGLASQLGEAQKDSLRAHKTLQNMIYRVYF